MVEATALEPLYKKPKEKYDSFLEEQVEEMLIEETPEMLAAIDEGLRSIKEEGSIPIEVVKAQLQKKWGRF